MKVQHDTGWNLLTNRALSEKPVDKLEETNEKLSGYSSTLTDIWTAKDLRQRNNTQKPEKRHRFPPSLLSSRALDFWNTLMPLRANCSCSSVSVGDKCSRLSFGVSSSDATFDSNLDRSVPSVQETAVQETLGDTLEHTHLGFKLLIGPMVRLLNVLNKKSDSSLSHVCSDSNLKTLSLSNPKLNENTEMIGKDSRCTFSSITSISSKSSNLWSTGRTGKKSESSTKFEIAEQKRRGKGWFSQKLAVRNSLGVTNSVLTLSNEELVYLLQYKKSLLSEYFRRNKVDSTDLKEKLDPSEKSSFIYGSQSDSGLQEHNLLQFVQFVRARKKKDAEDIIKTNSQSWGTERPGTKFQSVNNGDSRQLSIPKRRVTFSDPITDDSMTVLNCDSTDNEDGISSTQNSATAITNDADIPSGQFIQSDVLVDSKSPPFSESRVSLQTCLANLSLDSLSTRANDPNSDICELKTEQIDYSDKMLARESGPCYDTSNVEMTEKESEKKVKIVSMMDIRKLQPFANDNRLKESWSSTCSSSLQKGRKLGSAMDAKAIKEEMLTGLKFLVNEIVDYGTTHVPMFDEVFEEYSEQKNNGKCLKRKIRSVGVDENFDSIDYEHGTLNCEIEKESIRSKISGYSSIKRSKIPVKCDKKRITWSLPENRQLSNPAVAEDRSLPSGKTVTFQDCCQTISDQSIMSDQKELEPSLQSDDHLVPPSDSNGRFELSWKGCWNKQSKPKVVENTEKLEDNFTEDEEQSFELNSMAVPSESGDLTSTETYKAKSKPVSKNPEPSAAISDRQTSYYTSMGNDFELADDHKSKGRSKSLRYTSPSSCSYSSDSSTYSEKDEMIQPDEDPSRSCVPASEFHSEYESDSKSIEFENRTELRKGFENVYTGLRNPEIWRAEVRSAQAEAFCKSDWYARPDSDRYPWKIPKIRSDWLIKKLGKLQSRPETDYESDYYAESEMSDFECGKDLLLMKRSFANLDSQLKNCKMFKTKRSRFGPNLFVNKVWSGKKIIFNKCRCHKDTINNRYDLRSRDLRHTSFQDSDQRSNQNIFAHLRAKLILDSETDDSDFAPSIQPDFYYNLNRRDEHVNKIKCRRYVRSLKNIKSEEDGQFSSTGLLHVTFKKSFTPASVQCAFSTLTVGRDVSENQNCCSMIDVSIDTYDLCPRKPIETTNQASDFTFSKDNMSCQALERVLQERHAHVGSNLLVPKTREQSANPSTQINDASNNLIELRFLEIKTQPDRDVKFPDTSGYSSGTSPSLSKSSSPRTNSDSCTVKKSNCPICNIDQKPQPRYTLPACIVKGADPGLKSNDKDPWNRVMERAKAQHRYEGRNKSTFLEMKPSSKLSRAVSSASAPAHDLKFFERKNNHVRSEHSCREEVRIELPRVKNNSSQSGVSGPENSTEVDKIFFTPTRKYRQRRMPPAAAVCFPTSSNADHQILSLPRTRSPRRSTKPQALENTSNRLLYIISEKAELAHLQMPIKTPAANFFN